MISNQTKNIFRKMGPQGFEPWTIPRYEITLNIYWLKASCSTMLSIPKKFASFTGP